MKDFLKAPLNNLLGFVLILVLAAAALTGSVGAPAQLAPLSLTGGTSNVTGSLAVSSAITAGTTGTFGTGLTVTSGGETITAGGLTVTAGTVSLPASALTAAAITDITRTVSIPLASFIECTTDAGGSLLDFSSGADSHPDFINSATNGLGFVLAFDATGGSVDTDDVCSNLMVPADYASNGTFVVRATKGAETGANSELLTCAGSIDGAALLASGTITTTGTASAIYVCPATLTALAANDSLSFFLGITSGGTADDTVNLAAVSFAYLSTE